MSTTGKYIFIAFVFGVDFDRSYAQVWLAMSVERLLITMLNRMDLLLKITVMSLLENSERVISL